ncbi:MAG: DUF3798 domain-containing protein [Clostridiales bacterium]|nr:DUF3798 domain-containing protein [Clostridiales bacterium]
MKKLLCMLLAALLVLSMAALASAEGYKIAIMTGTTSQGEEEYYAATSLAEKYPGVVLHDTYPDAFSSEVETTISKLIAFAEDPEVKAIIFVQAVQGATAAYTQILNDMGRDDILLVAGVPAEDPADISAVADIVLANDEIGCGYQVADLASQWGCDVLVHYSFARHLSYETIVAKRDAMKNTADGYNITFVERDCPDPTGDAGMSGAQAAVLEDIPKVMQEYEGKKVCFYCTNCGLQVALQQAIVNQPNAYYALPCCPSPYHGFQEAFGLTATYGDIEGAIKNLATYLNDHDATNRFSTWALPVNMSMINGAFEYARLYAEGKTNGKVDMDVFSKCYSEAAGSEIELGKYVDASGKEYDNYLLIALEPINFADYLE